MFRGKTLLITGGTGSFGNAVLDRFLNSDFDEIRIFSRDELKQDLMRKKYNNRKLNRKLDKLIHYLLSVIVYFDESQTGDASFVVKDIYC